MRNLSVLHIKQALVDQNIKKQFSVDEESRAYVVTTENILYIWDISQNKEVNSIPLEGDDLLDPGSTITGCCYIPDLESCCICTLAGDILVYDNATGEAEVVGCLDSGILSMAWSPDYELVIFATKQGTLVEMTKDWEPVTEVHIDNEASKQLPHDDYTVNLSWRGDGKVFSCLASRTNNHKVATVHIFDRACVKESTSESNVDVEPSNLSWRPSGSVITCTQRFPQKYDTIFFERNGLRHGEFSFRSDCSVGQLEWNSASDLLAILIKENDKTSIQIWHMNNWHWYLKQEFRFDKENSGDEVLGFHWDEEDSMKLVCILASGEIRQYLFHWDTNVCSELSINNQSVIGVIDGNDLLLSPLRRLVPPPPMAATTLSTNSPIQQIFFSPKDFNIFIIHSDNTLECYKTMELPEYNPGIKKPGVKGFTGTGEPPVFDNNPKLLSKLNSSDLLLSSFYQWTCYDEFTLLALSSDIDDISNTCINILNVFEYSIDNSNLTKISQVKLPSNPLRLYSNPDTGSVFISLESSEVLKFTLPDNLTNYSSLPTPCSTIQSVKFGSIKEKADSLESLESLDDLEFDDDEFDDREEILIALNNRSRLYVNGIECSRECNSFSVHEKYILFTTLTHKLRFIDHSEEFSQDLLETTPQHTYDVCNREVERGSRIVAVIPYDTKVILQMPRGNLETIYPRALLLSHCRNLLNNLDYRNAFLIMRHHRIDLNLLYDHNPTQFMNNVELFINSLDSITFLNLFLSSLIEDDVTVTLFPSKVSSSISLPVYLQKDRKIGKVNKICTIIRETLRNIDSNRYLLSILTTLVKSNPPKYGEALDIIRTIRIEESKEDEKIDDEKKSSKIITAESALNYLVFLVDVNQLYDVALSLYDFELTIMVAGKSQKDPKEYLPFLKNLHDLSPSSYQKYEIDMYLQNYKKALTHISSLNEDEHYQRALELIKKQNLYSLGIKLYYSNELRRKEIQGIYGKFLFSNANFEEAAILFQQCNMYNDALTSYMQTTNWQMVLAMANKMEYDDKKINELANDLSSSYLNMGRFNDAATILLEYLNNPESAIRALTQGCLWENALRLSYKFNLSNLIDEIIKPAVEESQLIHVEMTETKLEQYEKQFERLKVVKRSKILMPKLALLPTDAHLGDVFSETSSFASSRSSFSYVSMSEGGTRKRKRKKKKRISGKEGSQYEEEFLVEALKKLIPTKEHKLEINRLLKILFILGFNDEAEELQNLFSKFTLLVDSSLDVLISPIVPMPGHEEEEEQDRQVREKIELKEKMDRMNPPENWLLSCVLSEKEQN